MASRGGRFSGTGSRSSRSSSAGRPGDQVEVELLAGVGAVGRRRCASDCGRMPTAERGDEHRSGGWRRTGRSTTAMRTLTGLPCSFAVSRRTTRSACRDGDEHVAASTPGARRIGGQRTSTISRRSGVDAGDANELPSTSSPPTARSSVVVAATDSIGPSTDPGHLRPRRGLGQRFTEIDEEDLRPGNADPVRERLVRAADRGGCAARTPAARPASPPAGGPSCRDCPVSGSTR